MEKFGAKGWLEARADILGADERKWDISVNHEQSQTQGKQPINNREWKREEGKQQRELWKTKRYLHHDLGMNGTWARLYWEGQKKHVDVTKGLTGSCVKKQGTPPPTVMQIESARWSCEDWSRDGSTDGDERGVSVGTLRWETLNMVILGVWRCRRKEWIEDEKTWITKGVGRNQVVSVSDEQGGEKKAEGRQTCKCLQVLCPFSLGRKVAKTCVCKQQEAEWVEEVSLFLSGKVNFARKTDRGSNSDCHSSTEAAFLYELSWSGVNGGDPRWELRRIRPC